MARFAAIDVGSTSVHLLVADVRDGVVRPIADESAFAGLGEAVEMAGRLGDARTTELAGLLAGYVRRATDAGADDVLVLTTAPLRRAADAARVVRRLASVLGVVVHVLSEREEALLTVLGATGGVVPPGGLVLVDVGGGSTEIAAVAPGRRPEVAAVPLGAATLAGRHVTSDPPPVEAVAAMRNDARAGAARLRVMAAGVAVAVGGTADNLARVAGTPDLTHDAIERALERLSALAADEVASMFGVRVARARLLPAGAAILLAVMEQMRIDAITVSAAGLREGAILARAASGPAWRDRLEPLAGAWPRGPLAR